MIRLEGMTMAKRMFKSTSEEKYMQDKWAAVEAMKSDEKLGEMNC